MPLLMRFITKLSLTLIFILSSQLLTLMAQPATYALTRPFAQTDLVEAYEGLEKPFNISVNIQFTVWQLKGDTRAKNLANEKQKEDSLLATFPKESYEVRYFNLTQDKNVDIETRKAFLYDWINQTAEAEQTAQWLTQMADYLYQNADIERAKRLNTKALQKNNQYIPALRLQIQLDFESQYISSVLENAEKILNIAPGDKDALLFQLQIQTLMKFMMEGEATYTINESYIKQAIEKYPKEPYYKNLQNAIQTFALFYEVIAEVFGNDDKNENDDDFNIKQLKKVSSKHQTQLDELKSYFQKRNKKELAENGVGDNILGFLSFLEGNAKQATKHYQKALKKDPEIIDAYNSLAFIAYSESQYPQAIQYIEDKIKATQNANEDDYLLLIGLAYEMQNQKQMFEYIQKAQKAYPQSLELLTVFAQMEAEFADLDKALTYIKNAEEISTQNSRLQHLKGILYLRKGNAEEAHFALQSAMLMDNEAAHELLKKWIVKK
ncbi:MAG: hypothetical protein JJT94_14815 [Bernardetiaceae bacterium]|nr:hypothetical protein [Bernardetiaceae bacterium]